MRRDRFSEDSGAKSPCGGPPPPALLVSVRNAVEARSAIDGGCGILDVKEPARGSLGMADAAEIEAILEARNRFAPSMPVSIALGEAKEEPAAILPRFGGGEAIQYVKLGTAGLGALPDWRDVYRRAREAWDGRLRPESSGPGPQWVAVAYADWQLADAPPVADVMAGATESGCSGLLIDTFTKSAGGLFHWLEVDELKALAAAARRHRLWFALAGQLKPEDVSRLCALAPDVVGIRTAACRRLCREGEVEAAAVRSFRNLLGN